MLEIPESYTIASQLNQVVLGKKIVNVEVASSPHSLAFYFGDISNYPQLLIGKTIDTSTSLAGFIEIHVQDVRILFGDGTNLRYYERDETLPIKHQLKLDLDDGSCLMCTIQMYGGIYVFFEGTNDNPYYLVAMEKPSPLSEKFDEVYFSEMMCKAKQTLSAKAFLATEQRIPGLGNGCLQDILIDCNIHPKRKLNTLQDEEKRKLFLSVKSIIKEMSEKGGRDTEKNLFGMNGGYKTILSNKTYKEPCTICGGDINRQAYLGGNIYFCKNCQPI